MDANGKNDLGFDLAIASGIIGSMISAWLATEWSRSIPLSSKKAQRARLLNKYGTTLSVANALSIAGAIAGVDLYFQGGLRKDDWRGLAIAGGLMFFLPVSYMVLVNVKRGREAVRECLVAYAIDVKIPPTVLIVFASILVACGFVSAVSLIFFGR
jgi:hypothetical protein